MKGQRLRTWEECRDKVAEKHGKHFTVGGVKQIGYRAMQKIAKKLQSRMFGKNP